jgi:transposase
MVRSQRRSRKGQGVVFRSPPWHEQSPEYQALDERLAEDHVARAIAQGVAGLDVRDFLATYDGSGSQPYPPALLLAVVLYEMRLGRRSPAQWARDAHESEPARWLLRGCEPSRARWYAFRDRVAPHLLSWNRQILEQAQAEQLTRGERAALDGTLTAANASRHHLLNETRLEQRLTQLAEVVAADAKLATPTAATEPPPAAALPAEALPEVPSVALPPAATPVPPGWLAKTVAGRLKQQQRYQKAQLRMEEMQQRNQDKRSSKRKERDKIVVSTSDPEAALGRDKDKVYRPLYNTQLLRDLDSPFILGYQVFAQPNDNGTLGPMLERQMELLGHKINVWLADAGYASGEHLAIADAAGVELLAPWQENDYSATKAKKNSYFTKQKFPWLPEEKAYACPQGHRLPLDMASKQKRSGTETVLLYQYRCPPGHCQSCPLQTRCTPSPAAGRTISRSEHEDLIEALRARMATPQAKELYRLRRQTVELNYADLKEHRKLRRFSGHGLCRAETEVGLEVLVHNLLALANAGPPKESERSATRIPEKIGA